MTLRARRAALAAGLVVALTACGTSRPTAGTALRATAKKLDTIRSGRLDLRLDATSPAAKGAVGFALKGPFALPKEKGLPVADVEVTEQRGTKSATVHFVSTGQRAYVVRGGAVTALPGDAGLDVGGDAGLGTLRIDRWLRDPKLSDGGEVGGTATDHVTAGLDVAAAFDDLARLGEQLHAATLAGLKPLDEQTRAQLQRAASASSVEVWTGKKDRLLRRLVLTVTLTSAGGVPEPLRALLPVTLALHLDLAAVNEPVHVDDPTGGTP